VPFNRKKLHEKPRQFIRIYLLGRRLGNALAFNPHLAGTGKLYNNI